LFRGFFSSFHPKFLISFLNFLKEFETFELSKAEVHVSFSENQGL